MCSHHRARSRLVVVLRLSVSYQCYRRSQRFNSTFAVRVHNPVDLTFSQPIVARGPTFT